MNAEIKTMKIKVLVFFFLVPLLGCTPTFVKLSLIGPHYLAHERNAIWLEAQVNRLEEEIREMEKGVGQSQANKPFLWQDGRLESEFVTQEEILDGKKELLAKLETQLSNVKKEMYRLRSTHIDELFEDLKDKYPGQLDDSQMVLSLEVQLEMEEQLIVAELADAGIQVASIWDLVNEKSSYAPAIPVLMRHLQLPHHLEIREGIARSLAVREAQGEAGRIILNELKKPIGNSLELRWALANALTEAADQSMVGEIKELVENIHYKDVREVLKLALENLARRDAPPSYKRCHELRIYP